MNEEQLRAVTIGEPALHNAPITLVDYDPRWPLLFEREAVRIRTALGDRALRIEHTGSTSVPGLVAKAIIDIVLEVDDSSDEPAYIPALEAAGYVLRVREPDWFEHRCLKGPDTAVNLHVFGRGCLEIERMLRFRDWLRTHPGERERYAEAKRTLAQRQWKYVQNYADAKGPIVEEILAVSSLDSARPLDSARDDNRPSTPLGMTIVPRLRSG